jgi:hypothetical protein
VFISLPKIRAFCFALAALVMIAASFGNAYSQRRDFLTDTEIDLIRESQDLDTRIDVLTKMIDRRFLLLNMDTGGWDGKKHADKFGDAPKGTRLELLFDIKRLLQKAIDDIDNRAERPDSALIREDSEYKQARKDPQRFGIAVRTLGAAAKRYVDPLRKLYDTAGSEKELGVISDSLNSCELIIESLEQLPPDAEPNKKKKKKD